MKLFPQWINKRWSENSMGAADKKSDWVACIGWTIVVIVVLILATTMRGEGVPFHWKAASYLTSIACIYAVWKSPDLDNQGSYWIGVVVGIALMIGFAIGFQ